jgi:hypothetical protein
MKMVMWKINNGNSIPTWLKGIDVNAVGLILTTTIMIMVITPYLNPRK